MKAAGYAAPYLPLAVCWIPRPQNPNDCRTEAEPVEQISHWYTAITLTAQYAVTEDVTVAKMLIICNKSDFYKNTSPGRRKSL